MKKIASLLLLAFFVSCSFGTEYATLQRISDGDTFTFRSAEKGKFRCRLFGIDTPEKFAGKKLDRDAKACNIGVEKMKEAGEVSTKYAEEALQIGKSYKISVRDKDHYGRYICEVYVPHLAQGSYNKAIVAEGYAVAYVKYIPNATERREYNKLQAEAKRNGAGLWGNSARMMECLAKEAM